MIEMQVTDYSCYSLGESHDGINHVAMTLAESLDGLVSCAARLNYNNINVCSGYSFFAERCLVTGQLFPLVKSRYIAARTPFGMFFD